MDRLACVSFPELPLQLLLRDNPLWRSVPVVVVDEDSPRGVVQWANRVGRRSGIHVGMRYAVALSLCSELRAGVVAPSRIAECVDTLHAVLRKYSPVVEASSTEPGVFWLDASGLHHLYDSLTSWGEAVHGAVTAELEAAVVVGFDRLYVCSVAKSRALAGRTPQVWVFDDIVAESAVAHTIMLRDLGLNPSTCDTLHKLGVDTLSDFVRLPVSGVHERFGLEAFRLHQTATQVYAQRLMPTPYSEPASHTMLFDDAEADLERLTFAVKSGLHVLCRILSRRGEALAKLTLALKLERRLGDREEHVSPAMPTLDVMQLVELVRLKLAACALPAGASELTLTAESVPATQEQIGLFTVGERDIAAAGRALARLQAELGEESVVRAELKPAHLPEAQFVWQPTLSVSLPQVARRQNRRPLVRRFFPKPVALSAPPRAIRNDGWQPAGTSAGAVTSMHGPFVVSGGWWRREVQRHYHFIELQNQELLWVYFDLTRRQWFAQGRVE